MENDLRRWMTLVEQTSLAAWFGTSKVVDAAGHPLRVYHGTGANILAFDRENPRMKNGKLGRGIYLTPSTEAANLFARIRAKDGAANILPLYVKIEHPFEVFGENNVNFANPIDRETLERNGYDGVLLYRDDGKTLAEIVAFRPNQVKSAIGNRGTYNPDDARITEADAT